MHRTGTSAIAGVLSKLGAATPKTPMKPTKYNPKGYFESTALMVFHDRVLASAGSHWADWTPFNEDWFAAPGYQDFQSELSHLIDQEFPGAGLFISKDPRICRFAQLWTDTLDGMDIDTRILLPLRNPFEVAASLQRRDGFPLEKALLLWLRHVLDAEYASRGRKRVFVRYAHLIEDWRLLTSRVAEALDLKWPRRSAKSELEIDEFIDLSLRHSWIEDTVWGDYPAPDWVRRTYDALLALCDSPDDPTAITEIDATRTALGAATQLVGPHTLRLDQQRQQAEEALQAEARKFDERDANFKHDLNEARAAHEKLEGEKAELTRRLNETGSEHARLKDETAELRAAHEKLEGEKAELARRLDETGSEHARLKDETAELRAAHEKLEGEKAELARRLDETGSEHARLKDETAELRAAHEKLEGEKAELARRLDETGSEHARLKDETAELRAAHEKLEGEKAELARRLDETGSEHARLKDETAELRAAHEKLEGEKAELARRLDETGSEHARLKDETAELRAAHEKLEGEKAELARRLDETGSEHARLKDETAELRAAHEKLEGEKAELARRLDETGSEHARLKDETAELRAAHEKLEGEKAELARRLDETGSEHARLKDETAELRAAHEKLEGEKAELARRLDETGSEHARLKDETAELRAAHEKLEGEKAELARRLDETGSEHARLKDETAELRAAHEKLEGEKAELARRLDETGSEHARLKDETAELRAAHEKLEGEKAELARRLDETGSEHARLKDETAELRAAHEKLEGEKAELARRLDETGSEHARLKDETAELRAAHEKLEGEKAELARRLDETGSENETLSRRIAETSSQTESSKAQHQAECKRSKSLELDLARARAEVDVARNAKKAGALRLASLEDKLDKARAQIDRLNLEKRAAEAVRKAAVAQERPPSDEAARSVGEETASLKRRLDRAVERYREQGLALDATQKRLEELQAWRQRDLRSKRGSTNQAHPVEIAPKDDIATLKAELAKTEADLAEAVDALGFKQAKMRKAERASETFAIAQLTAPPDPLDDSQLPLLDELAFSTSFYNRQLAALGLPEVENAAAHYLTRGARIGLSPHPLFDPAWYIKHNPDVAAAGVQAYIHFLLNGGLEGRPPHPLFDSKWYLHQNTDVMECGLNPLIHYLSSGWKEGRDPSPNFSTSWYLSQYPDVDEAGIAPLEHYARWGWIEGRRPTPWFDPKWYSAEHLKYSDEDPFRHYILEGRARGLRPSPPPAAKAEAQVCAPGGKRPPPERDQRTSVLFVAHVAGKQLFGGERSFLDLLNAVDRNRYRVIAALPRPHPNYRKQVEALTDLTVDCPPKWWLGDAGPNEEIVKHFSEIIRSEEVEIVYANTIMLEECLVAARRLGVRSVCHVREAIDQDDVLQEMIGLPSGRIIKAVLERSDYVVANSECIRRMFEKRGASFKIFNAVDTDRLDLARLAVKDGALRVGMISSNLPKKGLADFEELARLAAQELPNARFFLIGPHTNAIKELMARMEAGEVPANIECPGYADDVVEALRDLHVVVNFSWFAESFGRTIAEAMAARRPVIVYERGALPELVEDGRTGFVVPYRSPAEALGRLVKLAADPDSYAAIADAARARARRCFSYPAMHRDLNGALGAMLRGEAASADGLPPSYCAPTVTAIVPNYNYADYLPDRIGSILEQTRKPDEIIILDDASTDDSVAVARRLLDGCDIPHRVIANNENKGIYRQWLSGISLSSSEWIWIAEADDKCEPEFLETLLRETHSGVNVVYSQSRRIDGDGRETAPDNLGHTNDLSTSRWRTPYREAGIREVVDVLAYRNTIPNVSAALLRRDAIRGIEPELSQSRFCGDWLLYAHLMSSGDVAYVAEALNHFRRHQKSATRREGQAAGYLEEILSIHEYIAERFPLREKDVDRFVSFLDRDYTITGVGQNSAHPQAIKVLDRTRALAKRRRRIAFVTTNNGSWTGGSEVLWRDAARRLASDGNDVLALSKRWVPRPDVYNRLLKAGVSLLYKEDDGWKRLLETEPDLVVVSTGDQDEGVAYFPDLVSREIPFVIVNQLTKDPRFWDLRHERTPVIAQAYRHAKLGLFASRNNQRLMQERLGFELANGGVHFNPFHVDAADPPPQPGHEGELNIAVPAKLLFVHKGQDLLVPIFAKERWKKRPITVNFYGEGADEDTLRAMADDAGVTQFRFHGRVPDIAEIWEKNDALLMPSRMEGLPIMLVSAMVWGRVPIVTDIGGHAEVVEDGVSGFIARDPDSEAIERALEKAWAARNAWAQIGAAARRQILDYLPDDPVGDFVGRLISCLGLEGDEARPEAELSSRNPEPVTLSCGTTHVSSV